jgi:hypothetical protein
MLNLQIADGYPFANKVKINLNMLGPVREQSEDQSRYA